ncbi:MAG: hypothetical protein ACI4IH_01275 [Eubacterium sp.]
MIRQEQICDSADPFVCFADISPNRGITPALRDFERIPDLRVFEKRCKKRRRTSAPPAINYIAKKPALNFP